MRTSSIASFMDLSPVPTTSQKSLSLSRSMLPAMDEHGDSDEDDHDDDSRDTAAAV
eukprot:CAMPEP_0202720598 /NCGR_PEP_ID=MMETSP1385-20130828/141548_1 /ASSEMBLY_ACC=CAM_ASM_000861 /TAXON_ID=933848 /ORGANISM="Elphidium margaritaceum" /LENGTH=55 /DNA_ID=CAMNT_0049384403 /DNA_START=1 /DNA_END=164 /DNA_ORIENTATION=-